MIHPHAWLGRVIDTPVVNTLCDKLRRGGQVIANGSWGSSTSLLAGAIAVCTKQPVLLVMAHLDEADDALEDLALFKESGHPILPQRFAALEVLPSEPSVSLELLAERLAVVQELVSEHHASSRKSQTSILIAPIQALMQAVPRRDTLDSHFLTIQSKASLLPAKLLDWLDRSGYQRVEAVEQPCEFTTRGGIIDIYPPAGQADHVTGNGLGAIRLDYYGDEVESIAQIDLNTMGSGKQFEQVQILGADTTQLQSDEHTTTLIELLHGDTIVVMHEMMELSEQARGYYERLTNPCGIYPPQTVFKELSSRPSVQVNQYGNRSKHEENTILPLRSLQSFNLEISKAIVELGELTNDEENKVVVICQRSAERDRLIELLNELAPGTESKLTTDVGYLHRGFIWDTTDGERAHPSHLHLIPRHELFHRYEYSGMRRRIRRLRATDESSQHADVFFDLDVGDYVVHVDHGIARFIGIKTLKRKTGTQEYLTLEFANHALLHVPATQIELVQRYIGGFEGRPPLSALGSKRWAKQKKQVTEAVKDLAVELLRVQSARATMPGIRFPADTIWQREFEAEFPYPETEDQLAAIVEVKQDMATDQPMDRLICGDVGFGKTEVAVRAAFKAAEYGKQVAILVPTTVLAIQHQRTFCDRVADYPFRVEMLSRFKTTSEQTAILTDLAKGRIDIVIGTHRLLSKDVKFADLGMVIIDEEQRFGVEHKQKLLQFRLTADVLTLTATPIPRTLHMALLGLRNISSLTTAPLDRRSIVTEVIPYCKQRIRQAIIRELNRDGQIFFVHNRVYNIDSIADEIHKLVPEARIVIGHGQMSARHLEQVMLRFVQRDADILVCTTIIESGLDIPTANTIFINHADRFGLADLHQLRGRVGRYKHRAYCYLLLPDDKPITDASAKRLKAIEQYTMLGAGFKISMRDLEIRGAGNVLGAKQSGHIATVGYEMYCQLLEKATKRIKNEPLIDPVHTHLELPIQAQIPKRYISSEKFRMEAYRRLSRASTPPELNDIASNLTDAYGPLPSPVHTLIDLTELRIAAATIGINSIKLDGPDLIFKTHYPHKLNPLLCHAPGRASIIDNETIYYRPPANFLESPSSLLAVLRKLIVHSVRDKDTETVADN